MARKLLLTNRRKGQEGVAVVELTLVMILLVMLTFALMEYGWMFFRMQQVTNAAHAGAREASLPDSTTASVQSTINDMMTDFGISGHTITMSPADVTTAQPGDAVEVSISLPYANVELTGLSLFPTPTNLFSEATMAKEGP